MSANIIIVLRLKLSIHKPANGPIIACGNNPAIDANVIAKADPVVDVIHQMIENCIALEGNMERDCPI